MRHLALVLVFSSVCCNQEITLEPEGGAAGGTAGGAGAGAGNGNGNGPGNGSGGAGSGAAAPPPTPRQFFEERVAPALNSGCANCHSSSNGGPAPKFLGSGTPAYYGSLIADGRLVGATPATSLLVTKGAHEGPAFLPSQLPAVQQWIQLEAAAGRVPPPPMAGSGGAGAGGAGAGGAGAGGV